MLVVVPDMLTAAEKSTMPRIRSRESWQAKQPTGPYEPHVLTRITIHHQALVFHVRDDAKRRLRIMQQYHQHPTKGFVDIAYHFIIDRRGNIYEGRPVAYAGEASVGYDPTGHLLICLLGDFRKQYPTRWQRNALVALLSWAIREFNLSKKTIRGHRDYYENTTCPGKNLYHLITSKAFLDKLPDSPDEEAGRRSDAGNTEINVDEGDTKE
jgi:hypothetical protein